MPTDQHQLNGHMLEKQEESKAFIYTTNAPHSQRSNQLNGHMPEKQHKSNTSIYITNGSHAQISTPTQRSHAGETT